MTMLISFTKDMNFLDLKIKQNIFDVKFQDLRTPCVVQLLCQHSSYPNQKGINLWPVGFEDSCIISFSVLRTDKLNSISSL